MDNHGNLFKKTETLLAVFERKNITTVNSLSNDIVIMPIFENINPNEIH